MSITDELRAYTEKQIKWVDMTKVHYHELFRIADRIDAEHEKAAAGCIHYDPERHYCSVHGDTENGWVRLPKDADGEPIHVGDRVEYLTGGRDIVRFVTLNGDGWTVNERGWKPCTMRRITPPTVEDVLFEFARFWSDEELTDIEHLQPHAAQTIAEYAAKLRLKEGE